MKFLVVIPARFKSSRFPGKPLAIIKGKPMIQRVYEQCVKGFDGQIIIATDSVKIQNFCQKNNIPVELTSKSCKTGSDRVAEISGKYQFDYYVNVQGDEPIFNPHDLTTFINKIKSQKEDYSVFAGYTLITNPDEYFSSQIPKMVFNKNKELIYTSRSPIPSNKENTFTKSFKQVCVYGFSKSALEKYSKRISKTPLEEIEDLELLRFIEIGEKIKMISLSDTAISVDNPEDIFKVEKKLITE
ncbi:MAG: 3-deoxy-manno-octulosonate cytidylyltransferase [Flavobacteriaceae bacterium]|jgi:3-deoxy-manno-octulosonate cytidylyltransferase (CMP-KDO synthetase)|nr:3-deoxy-manno-octulosonate cytidylyltransferase [Flavobacteriaceae bacterium]MBT6448365.1 3-deoxy-manno-octulosonate cytidylyltransferase [Flavobacteriaceae bacterium]